MNILSYKTKIIFDNKNDRQKIIELLESGRKAFNEASKICYTLNNLNIVNLHSKFYKDFRNNNHIPSQVVIKAENSCLSAYKSIKSRKHKILQPIIKKRLSLQLDQRLFSYKAEDKILRLTTLEKRINVKFIIYKKLDQLLSQYKFGDPILFFENNEIYISFPFKIETKFNNKSNFALGIDLGIRRFVATSDGKIYKDKKFLKEKRELRYLKDKLKSASKNGSKTAKKHLNKLKNKEHNINKNFNHHLVNNILSTLHNIIVVEDLDIIKLKKKKNAYQNKNRISQIGFGNFLFILQYKAGLIGKKVVKVNPAYTSQIDPVTCKREGERKGCRFYSKSGLIYDADCSAAINIARLSQLPFSCKFTLDGQAVINQPIVR